MVERSRADRLSEARVAFLAAGEEGDGGVSGDGASIPAVDSHASIDLRDTAGAAAPVPALEQLAANITALTEQVDRGVSTDARHSELLATLLAEQHKSLRRRAVDAGVVVAVIGLLFTGFTYWLGMVKADRDDKRQAEAQLVTAIGELNAIPRLALAVQSDAATGTLRAQNESAEDLAALRAQIATQVNGDIVVGEQDRLIAQADAIIAEYPDLHRPFYALVLGAAHAREMELDRALAELDYAYHRTTEHRVWLAAGRGAASAWFQMGELGKARERMQELLDFERKFPGKTPLYNDSTRVQTLNWWSGQESFHDCRASLRLLGEAVDLAARNRYLTSNFRDAERSMYTFTAGKCGTRRELATKIAAMGAVPGLDGTQPPDAKPPSSLEDRSGS